MEARTPPIKKGEVAGSSPASFDDHDFDLNSSCNELFDG